MLGKDCKHHPWFPASVCWPSFEMPGILLIPVARRTTGTRAGALVFALSSAELIT
jgi:hypothetical protein